MPDTALDVVGLVLDGLQDAVEALRPNSHPALAGEVLDAITTARQQLQEIPVPEQPEPRPEPLRFTSDGSRYGATVHHNGQLVDGIAAATIELRIGQVPTAMVEVAVTSHIDVATGDVHWYGLDQVPLDALLAELARRAPTPQWGIRWPYSAWVAPIPEYAARQAADLHPEATLVQRNTPDSEWQPAEHDQAPVDDTTPDGVGQGVALVCDTDSGWKTAP